MTIDDGPSIDMQQKLDLLIRKNIPCVWFCRGDFLEERPEVVKNAIRAGHHIGNHSYSHPGFSDISLTEAIAEIRKTDTIIQKLYDDSNVEWKHKFFRFPHGDKGDFLHGDLEKIPSEQGQLRKDAIQSYLKLLGYKQPNFSGVTNTYHRNMGILNDIDWRWTFDVIEYATLYDGKYELRTIDEVYKRLDSDHVERGQSINSTNTDEIILVHDMPETTEYFSEIIERLTAKNLQFTDVTAQDLVT